ncbi:MAG TPA: FAD:protein FMN transferase [Steroidobacteraceae bacterium]|jgi:thiamine biosynthesis lipoprotein|nr:FAD:protein FMN transferase [Steroidobacteraceae bacterium]
MGSPCEVLVDSVHEQPVQAVTSAVAACAWRIEQKFSRYRDDSVVTQINRAAGTPFEVDEETARLLDFADHMWRFSEGKFDITSGVLRRAWTFDGRSRVPSAGEIHALMPLVGWSRVTWQRPLLTLRNGMEIDFGGIGKEYAVDLALAAATELTADPVLVNFGGDLAATGPQRDGRAWRVGVEGVSSSNIPWTLELAGGAMATSGDTYRYVTEAGERRPHILDPRTGEPVRGAPQSITVAAPTCVQAGMCCTLAMLEGASAEAFLRHEGVRFWVQRV